MHAPGKGVYQSIRTSGSLYLSAHHHQLGGDDLQLGGDVQANTFTVSFILFTF